MSYYVQVVNTTYHHRPITQVLGNEELIALFDLRFEKEIHIILKVKAPTQKSPGMAIGARFVKNMAKY